MPGIIRQEMTADQPVRGIAEDVSFVLVDSIRGTVKRKLVTDFGQYLKYFGTYMPDSYCTYSVRGYFNNGGKNLWVQRVTGSDATASGGAEDDKLELSKAQLVHGLADAELDVVAAVRGMDGLEVNVTIAANTSDVTEVEVTDTYDVALSLADTSAWKKCAKVCSTVLNGHSHLIRAGHAAPDANNSIVFYATTAGSDGDDYSVKIIDSGGGGLTESFDATGYILTIDLGGATPTAAAVVAALPVGGLSAYVTGTGLGTWNLAVAEAHLAGGNDDVGSIIDATYGGTGLSAVGNLSKTYLVGTGSLTSGSDEFTDTDVVGGFDAIVSKIVPGDVLVIINGANKGAYNIEEVTASGTLVLDRNASATQSNCLYKVFGTSGEYGHVSAFVDFDGEGGDELQVVIAKEYGGSTLSAIVYAVETDSGTTYELETFTGLSPIPTNAKFIDTVINTDSEWVTIESRPEKIICSGTGSSTAADNTLTHAGATFVDDGVSVGDLVIVTSATTAADVRVYTVLDVTDNTHLELSANFTGTQADVVYAISGVDTTGSALLALVGSTGITLTFDGGVSDTPIVTDYVGVEANKTGVYALDDIPESAKPRKMWIPDGPIVVDGSGVSACDTLNRTMGNVVKAKGYLKYEFMGEAGHNPAALIAAAEVDGIDNEYVGEYVNWGYMLDPLTDRYKLCPLVGHMVGLADAVSVGPEGIHQPLANIPLADVESLQYEITDGEYSLLCQANLNTIRRVNGIRNMGDYMRTTNSAWRWMHKRDVTIVLINSIYKALSIWGPWSLMVPSTLGKVRKSVEGYLRRYDRRYTPNGSLLNVSNPTEKPYYISCDLNNNDLKGTVLTAEVGLSIVNVAETVILRYGLWDGGASITTA